MTARAWPAAWRLAPVVLLAGCAAGQPAPVEDRGSGTPATPAPASATWSPPPAADAEPSPGVTILPLDAQVPAPAEPSAAPAAPGAPAAGPAGPANPAVVALLNQANRESGAGRHAGAAAALERAIRIEPGNAWLWHRLAQARFTQGRAGEAASLAARSNSLAGPDTRLQAENWQLIARVHRERGEEVAAREAERRARELGAPAT